MAKFSNFRLIAAGLLGGAAILAITLSLTRAGVDVETQRARRPVSARAQERIEHAVGHQLRMLPYYSVFDNFEYRVKGYDVELYGQVTRPTLRSDAENVVKRIEGVERVTNNIEVLPLSAHDDRIRRAVYRAVYSNSMLSRYALQAVPPIHIVVKNGNVTLVGVVASEAESNVAAIQANGVSGVFSVTNRLWVEGTRRKT